MSALVFIDNTVLSNFGRVGQSILLLQIWRDSARTSEASLAEYARGARTGLMPPDVWRDLLVEPLTELEQRFAVALPVTLGDGERTCLALAYQRQGSIATDDYAARRTAKRLGTPISGTVGTLLFAVKQGLLALEQANEILELMIANDYHSPVRTLDELLKR